MYGYVFAASEAGLRHILTHGVVKYAQWPQDHLGKKDYIRDPYLIHYGIDFNIGANYNWNKMVYKKLDLFACEPRYFGPPPEPHRAISSMAMTLKKVS